MQTDLKVSTTIPFNTAHCDFFFFFFFSKGLQVDLIDVGESTLKIPADYVMFWEIVDSNVTYT